MDPHSNIWAPTGPLKDLLQDGFSGPIILDIGCNRQFEWRANGALMYGQLWAIILVFFVTENSLNRFGGCLVPRGPD
jgi:hypothetical protein